MSTYAVSDLHGCYNFYKQIKNFIKPEDVVYCLGDCGDRGPLGWETIKAVAKDSQIICLKGNHEDMLVKAMRDYLDDYVNSKNTLLLAQNGGMSTLNGWWIDDPNWHKSWMKYIDALPEFATYENSQGHRILLSHAGFTPYEGLPEPMVKNELFENKHWAEKLLWDRNHFLDEWDECEYYKNTIIIHGHTPTPYLAEDLALEELEPGALWYCDNHKCCIDSGACFTGICTLLNLDTFEEHIFEEVKNGKSE